MAEKYPYTEIGAAVRAARTAAGLTQQGLADAIGASRETVINWERGQKRPDRFWPQLSQTLDLDADYLRLVGDVIFAREQMTLAVAQLRELEDQLGRYQAATQPPRRRRGKL